MALPNGAGGYQLGDGNEGEVIIGVQTAPVSKAAAATLTPAELATGIIVYTGSTANLTVPLGADIDAAFPSMKVNSCFDFYIINTSAATATVTANTGCTLVGAAAVATATSCNWRVRKSADNTFVFNRVAG